MSGSDVLCEDGSSETVLGVVGFGEDFFDGGELGDAADWTEDF